MPSTRYLACIFCGRNTHLSRVKPESFKSFDSSWKILQVRHAEPGPGRGRRISGVGGFKIDQDRSLTIQDMLMSEEYRDLALAIKSKLLLIIQEYLKAGILSKNEINSILREAS